MTTRMTFVLAASPYSGTAAATVLKLATGVFDVGAAAETFLARGGEVHL